jgi:hypothetical protein
MPTRTRPAHRPTEPADPLADLRPGDDAPALPETEELAEAVKVRPTAGQEFHDEARAEIVAAFHKDTVATGMLHKGGTCGCRYLAALCLQIVLGAPQEPAQDEDDPDDEDEASDG